MSSQQPQTPRIPLLPTLIIAAVALAAGIWAAQALLVPRTMIDDELAASRFPVARQLAPFRLLDQHGQTFDNSTLQGKWSLLFFGYTHCPDVCPTTLAVLNGVARKLSGSDVPVQFVFVSVDPERDTPEQLARFVNYFNPDFTGATGTATELEALTRQLGVLHTRAADPQQPDNYLVDHSAAVFLTDPSGRYHAVFTPPLAADGIADDLRKMARAYR